MTTIAGTIGTKPIENKPATRWVRFQPDRMDLLVMGALYLLVIATFRLAFVGFTAARPIQLFLTFALAGMLLLGVIGPVGYTVLVRHRRLATLGIGRHNLGKTIVLGLVLAAIQFAATLAGYALPAPVDWVPLLMMSIVVGLFDSIFFRGFIQARLEQSFGIIPGIVVGAALYALYHFGFGMGAGEMLFLFGLGLAYATAFRITTNILVLWPLLTPLGAFYNNLKAGDIELPWLAILGFGEVLLAMGAVLFIAQLYVRRHPAEFRENTD